MTIVDIKEAFNQCEYPFYKDIAINGNQVDCTLYSTMTSYKFRVQLPLLHFEQLVHQISLQLIKIRSVELLHQQQKIIEMAS